MIQTKPFFTHASSQTHTHTHHSTPPLRIHKDKSSQTRSCAEAMVLAAIMWIGADSMGACVSQHQGCVRMCVCVVGLQLGHSRGATRDKLYVSVSLFTCSVSLQ